MKADQLSDPMNDEPTSLRLPRSGSVTTNDANDHNLHRLEGV